MMSKELIAAILCAVLLHFCVCDSRVDSSITARSRRSDDSNPLEAVVSQLSQTVAQLQAQVSGLTAKTSELETAVGFTVRFSEPHVTGLGLNQPAVFDVVDFNAGGGYDRNTGVFTVPRSGTYVLAFTLQRYDSEGVTTIFAIRKGDVTIASAEAGYSPFEHGARVVTVHLNEGETVTVQATLGTTVYGGMATVFTGFRFSPS